MVPLRLSGDPVNQIYLSANLMKKITFRIYGEKKKAIDNVIKTFTCFPHKPYKLPRPDVRTILLSLVFYPLELECMNIINFW